VKDHLVKLLGLNENEITKNEIRQIIIDDIKMNPYQPRKKFDEESLKELCESISEHGVLQPIIVRRIDGFYELVAGERRLRAAKMAGLNLIPALIRNLNDQETAEIALIENLQREDLSAIEEAEAYQQMLNQFGYTQDELAKKLGKSQSAIANKIRLLKLPVEIKTALQNGSLTERHARALLKIDDQATQLMYLQQIIKEQLNVRETDLLVERYTKQQNISREIPRKKMTKQKVIRVFKDLRLFKNSVKKLIRYLQESGVDVRTEEIDDGKTYRINITVNKHEQ